MTIDVTTLPAVDTRSRGELPLLVMPGEYNYIGVFLTFACSLNCSYCINRFGELKSGQRSMSGEEWSRGLNRIISRPDLPVTLQGGEPSLHPDFFTIMNGIRQELNIDLLTNLECDVENFMRQVPPERIARNAPYASIRVSYHPEEMLIEELAAKVLILLAAGYSIGIWGVEHPDFMAEIAKAHEYCTPLGIDFRTKEFLGEHNGVLHGQYKYPGACDRVVNKIVACRSTELLIGPCGDVYRCHGDLYAGRVAVGHILDPDLKIGTDFMQCRNFGACNPCDVKVKTNRFQQDGHTSVEIKR